MGAEAPVFSVRVLIRVGGFQPPTPHPLTTMNALKSGLNDLVMEMTGS